MTLILLYYIFKKIEKKHNFLEKLTHFLQEEENALLYDVQNLEYIHLKYLPKKL